jgi:hypothetical protein
METNFPTTQNRFPFFQTSEFLFAWTLPITWEFFIETLWLFCGPSLPTYVKFSIQYAVSYIQWTGFKPLWYNCYCVCNFWMDFVYLCSETQLGTISGRLLFTFLCASCVLQFTEWMFSLCRTSSFLVLCNVVHPVAVQCNLSNPN